MPLNTLNNDFRQRETLYELINLIDEKINKCKLEHLIAWEKNHKIDSSATDRKIKTLLAKKEELLTLFDTFY